MAPVIKRIPLAQPALIGNEKKYVNDCLRSGWVSSIGKYIPQFERAFAKFCNVKHALTCSNGTTALHLALLAMGVKPGDEVLVPTLTYIAVANAVRYCGAEPVFVDSEDRTWNIDPLKIEEKITKKTRGLIVVHLYGHPANMDPIMKIARRRHLFVVEDAAEGHGALYKGKKAGSIGDIGTFSFFGNKILTTGEGGMVTTHRKYLADKIRLLKGQGMSFTKRYWFVEIGYNYRMTNVQAALGLAQLENVGSHLNRRREIAALYFKHLKHLEDSIELPLEEAWATHCFWMFTILLKKGFPISRNKVMEKLKACGIETRPVFYPAHTLPPYRKSSSPRFPVAEDIAKRGMNLPTYYALSEKEILYIAEKITAICRKAK